MSTTVSRSTLIARRAAAAARQPRCQRVRFNSSTAGPTLQATTSPLVAGMIGGGTVLVGGYAYYHFSGAKDMVNTARSLHQSIKSAKDTAIRNVPQPNEIIQYLRGVAKSYGALIPGASSYIDATFDGLDELHRTHKDEVNAIVGKAYQDIQAVVQDGKVNTATAAKVFSILKIQSTELAELAKRVGGDLIGPVLDKHPEVKEKLGGGWDEMKTLVQDAKDTDVAKQAQSIYEDTSKKVWDVFSSGLSADGITKAKNLIEEKSKEIRDLSQKAARELWEKGQQQYLSKAPEDVKKLFSDDDTVTALVSGSGATATVVAIWNKVKEVSSSKAGFNEKSVTELKDLLQHKVEDARNRASEKGVGLEVAWKSAQSWLKTVPGGDKALEAVPDVDVTSLSKVAKSRSDEATSLLQETYSDVLKVLKEKGEKAKKLAEDTKDDAKKEKNKASETKSDSGKKN